MPPINKKRKFEEVKEEEEDSSDDESVVQGGQTGSEAGDGDASSLGPANIISFCKLINGLFTKHSDIKQVRLSHIFRTKDMKNDDAVEQFTKTNSIGFKDLNDTFFRYYKKASQVSVISAETAVDVVKAYAETGEAIELHPNYPPTPSKADNKKSYDDAMIKTMKAHVAELKEFLKTEDNLRQEHITYVTKRIAGFEKRIDPMSTVTAPKKKPGPKKQEAPKTAFEFFKTTKYDSYTDLEPEARDRKLLKKFNRLDEGTRQIFIDLEKAQGRS